MWESSFAMSTSRFMSALRSSAPWLCFASFVLTMRSEFLGGMGAFSFCFVVPDETFLRTVRWTILLFDFGSTTMETSMTLSGSTSGFCDHAQRELPQYNESATKMCRKTATTQNATSDRASESDSRRAIDSSVTGVHPPCRPDRKPSLRGAFPPFWLRCSLPPLIRDITICSNKHCLSDFIRQCSKFGWYPVR